MKMAHEGCLDNGGHSMDFSEGRLAKWIGNPLATPGPLDVVASKCVQKAR